MAIQKTLRQNTAWIFFALGIFLLSGISAYLYAVETKTIQIETNEAADQATESIRASARALFRDLRIFTELEHFVANTTDASIKTAMETFVRDLGTPFIYLQTIDASGRPLQTFSQDPKLFDAIHDPLLRERTNVLRVVQNTKAFAVSSPIELPSGESALLFAAPLIFNDEPSGITYGLVSVSYFYNALNTVCSKSDIGLKSFSHLGQLRRLLLARALSIPRQQPSKSPRGSMRFAGSRSQMELGRSPSRIPRFDFV